MILEHASMMMEEQVATRDEQGAVTARLARRLRGLRRAHGLSLDALARATGVSRSMISLVERGEASPTAVVLERLATGLGVPLAALFDDPAPVPSPLARAADQPVWTDPVSGYLRRNVSPPGAASPIDIVEVVFPPGARVAYETGARDPRVDQQVWVLEGAVEVTVGDAAHVLEAGDCLAFVLDVPVAFANPYDRPAHYAVVLVAAAPARAGRS
jgi:transcriptional regulator with XRE-family HTH domain